MTFNVDGKPQTIWTTATTVDQAVTALGIDTAGAELSTSRSSTIGREGLDLDIATEKKIVIKVAGKKRSVTTNAQTVARHWRTPRSPSTATTRSASPRPPRWSTAPSSATPGST